MQRSSPAAVGAWTLGAARPTHQAWGDVFQSIALVGDSTRDTDTESFDDLDDPIAAARTWLAARAELPEPLVEQAQRSVEVASAHMRELDILAGEVAQHANETGSVDFARLDQIDAKLAVLRAYCDRLRTLLDPTTLELEEARRRLATGLEAASGGGGLAALVAAL